MDNDTFMSMAISTAIEELEGTEATIFDGLHRLQQQVSHRCGSRGERLKERTTNGEGVLTAWQPSGGEGRGGGGEMHSSVQ